MAKKVLTTIKLQAPGGQASPAPPVGPALGQHGINIMEFVKAFNAQTANDMGTTIPVDSKVDKSIWQTEATFGGPIIKNRLTFFIAGRLRNDPVSRCCEPLTRQIQLPETTGP